MEWKPSAAANWRGILCFGVEAYHVEKLSPCKLFQKSEVVRAELSVHDRQPEWAEKFIVDRILGNSVVVHETDRVHQLQFTMRMICVLWFNKHTRSRIITD